MESRVRENFMHGSERGRWKRSHGKPSSHRASGLLYVRPLGGSLGKIAFYLQAHTVCVSLELGLWSALISNCRLIR